jgi:hypothetical protein
MKLEQISKQKKNIREHRKKERKEKNLDRMEKKNKNKRMHIKWYKKK